MVVVGVIVGLVGYFVLGAFGLLAVLVVVLLVVVVLFFVLHLFFFLSLWFGMWVQVPVPMPVELV